MPKLYQKLRLTTKSCLLFSKQTIKSFSCITDTHYWSNSVQKSEQHMCLTGNVQLDLIFSKNVDFPLVRS